MARSRDDPTPHEWTFLSNYAHVLVCIAKDRDVTLREVAAQVGITERAVVRIIRELEDAGVVTRVREGRRNHYEVDTSLRLRHPLEADKTVGDLLSALLSRREAAALRPPARGRSA
jgi:predicted transcriptional regulator